MHSIQITADSICDLSEELIEKWKVKIIPLYINKDGLSFQDMVDIHPQDIFDYFQQTGNLTTTSAVPTADYINLFRPIVEAGKQVIHINISSEMSACYQNALAAAAEFPDKSVFVVDSKNLSTAAGHVVLCACELAKQGMPAKQIFDQLRRQIIPNVEASFVIDTLSYLHKGGRCSTVAMLGANLLKLKPCIEVQDGKMTVGKKYRGAWEKCILQYVDERLKNRSDINLHRIFITHTLCSKEIIEQVRKQILKIAPFEQILETTAGCTISNHCGPNTLGILFLRK